MADLTEIIAEWNAWALKEAELKAVQLNFSPERKQAWLYGLGVIELKEALKV